MRESIQDGKQKANTDCGTKLVVEIPKSSFRDQTGNPARSDCAALCEYLQIVAESYLERYG